MDDRLPVTKTYKLFIDGKFPRSESGRTIPLTDSSGRTIAHVCRASRKDIRDAATAARKGHEAWAGASAYLRGQIMYRMAEMLEGKRDEFINVLKLSREPRAQARGRSSPVRATARSNGRHTSAPRTRRAARSSSATPDRELAAAIDRLIAYAGWADKYAQVLGCNNPVSGPYYNFTVPEPTGVVAILAPDDPPLQGLISLLAPPLCAGNAVIAIGGQSNAAQLTTAILGEVLATSDLPAGAVNLLTGDHAELAPIVATHRDIDAIHAATGRGGAGVPPAIAAQLREGAAENVKRVTIREVDDWFSDSCHDPWWIESFVEMKTIWHPSGT